MFAEPVSRKRPAWRLRSTLALIATNSCGARCTSSMTIFPLDALNEPRRIAGGPGEDGRVQAGRRIKRHLLADYPTTAVWVSIGRRLSMAECWFRRIVVAELAR